MLSKIISWLREKREIIQNRLQKEHDDRITAFVDGDSSRHNINRIITLKGMGYYEREHALPTGEKHG